MLTRSIIRSIQGTLNPRGTHCPIQEALNPRGTCCPIQETLNCRGTCCPIQSTVNCRGTCCPIQGTLKTRGTCCPIQGTERLRSPSGSIQGTQDPLRSRSPKGLWIGNMSTAWLTLWDIPVDNPTTASLTLEINGWSPMVESVVGLPINGSSKVPRPIPTFTTSSGNPGGKSGSNSVPTTLGPPRRPSTSTTLGPTDPSAADSKP